MEVVRQREHFSILNVFLQYLYSQIDKITLIMYFSLSYSYTKLHFYLDSFHAKTLTDDFIVPDCPLCA